MSTLEITRLEDIPQIASLICNGEINLKVQDGVVVFATTMIKNKLNINCNKYRPKKGDE